MYEPMKEREPVESGKPRDGWGSGRAREIRKCKLSLVSRACHPSYLGAEAGGAWRGYTSHS